jgi:hypothetical protein
MKQPALAMPAAFACGIALGLCPPCAWPASSQAFLASGFVIAACLVVGGILLTALQRLVLAGNGSMCGWIVLGVLSAAIVQQPLPFDHIVTIVEGGRINLRSPLRWHGALRDEPTPCRGV